jgi:hypothetical protein
MPRTRLGRLALAGDAVAVAAFAFFAGLVGVGQKGGDTFFSNPWLAWSIVVAAAAAIGAGIVGWLGILTGRDRSPAVVLAALVGTLVLSWVILEITIPH